MKRKRKALARRRARGKASGSPRVKRNPAPAPNAALREAIERFTGFRAQPPKSIRRERIPTPGRVVFELGELLMVGYATVRAGKRYNYRHDFGKARPLLVASSDGRHLFILGGGYKVTNDGIVG